MSLPNLVPDEGTRHPKTEGVMFVVYAPFGDDETLSAYPNGGDPELAKHPLFLNLLKVSSCGVHVSALIDLALDATYLVDIPAGCPSDARVVDRWKQDMTSPLTLAGLLNHAAQQAPYAALVLALEGHGAGYLPDIDARQLTQAAFTGNGQFEWKIDGDAANVYATADGEPTVAEGAPLLPVPCPVLPGNIRVIPTYRLGESLRLAEKASGKPLTVVHFNNCFNLAAEVMHTIAPYAQYAAGYPNYNFFSAGETYPVVFKKLQAEGKATHEQLATWFALANGDLLAAKGNHPTVGCVVRLNRMPKVAELIDDLSDELLAAMRNATAAERPGVIAKITQAIKDAQQFDTVQPQELETPDELTDLRSWAVELQKHDFSPTHVADAAKALEAELASVFRYGATDRPWTDLNVLWDFEKKPLAMSILLPDPLLIGLWDWRSPYYLDVNPSPANALVQPHVIEFLKLIGWVDFIIEYHEGVKFVGILPAAIPTFPIFNRSFEPRRPGGGGHCPPPAPDKHDPTEPDRPRSLGAA